MKFSCTQENLHQGLSVVSHIANKNINLPILSNVLIKCDTAGLKLLTTNLEIAINCVVRGKVEAAGEFTVPSKLFSDYVALLPKDRVDVSLEGNSLVISCGTYKTTLHGVPASEFPLIPTIDRKQRIAVSVSELKKAIGQVLFAVAPNESRPEISGVMMRFMPTSGGLRIVLAGTDSYRLAEKVVAADTTHSTSITESVSVIVPSRTVAELIRILGVFKDEASGPSQLEIFIGDNQIMFAFNNTEIVSRTIEGKYPDYRQLIPDRFETEVVVEKEELLRAVRTTSLFSRTGLNDVHLTFRPDQPIHLSSRNNQTGEHAVDLEGVVNGKNNEVTVNFRYFQDGIANIESGGVTLQLIDGMSPCVIRPVSDGKDGDYLYIVMPIRQ
ncbi:DNA polymerase III subunit beta [Candidatus Uhrbacteria bacterium RIFCSPHIGHO2_02_FULL_60_10]|uniref:Beta sliding clamp n=1 Tax=Candidatus Uhrbacteria bacterium RIFCSPHIGHO2_02_FULL_60_10 TaxID=1802392 RepID=A0A1F7U8E1_9BACT|nr:MAG: DNA polymerase III subunit beta [Candidatus Uhrbacteria bacterium RIFCSPHIGHO2_02_FULL_60_10]